MAFFKRPPVTAECVCSDHRGSSLGQTSTPGPRAPGAGAGAELPLTELLFYLEQVLHCCSLAGSSSSCTSDLAEAGMGGSMLIKSTGRRFQSWLLISLQSTKQPCCPVRAVLHSKGGDAWEGCGQGAADRQGLPNYLKVSKTKMCK